LKMTIKTLYPLNKNRLYAILERNILSDFSLFLKQGVFQRNQRFKVYDIRPIQPGFFE